MTTLTLFLLAFTVMALAFAVYNAFVSLGHLYKVIDTQDTRIQRLEDTVFGHKWNR